MTGLYFSGTGNSRIAAERFVSAAGFGDSYSVSIENSKAEEVLRTENEFVLAYPIYYSCLPRLLTDFLSANANALKGKRFFVIATAGFASGDGAGQAIRILKRAGAKILGSLHVRMPDNVTDIPTLPIDPQKTPAQLAAAELKIAAAAERFRQGRRVRVGFSFGFRTLFGAAQRLIFGRRVNRYHDRLKIDEALCVGCGRCSDHCPMRNIALRDGKAVALGCCTSCYRCVNLCPTRAITLLGKKVGLQYTVQEYLRDTE